MRVEYHCSIVRKYLLGWGGWRFKLIRAVADSLASEEIRKLRNRVCPFCGRRFRTKASLASHLRITGWRSVMIPSYGTDYPVKYEIYPTNPCPFLFNQLVIYIVSTYRNIKKMCTTYGKNLVLRVDGKKYRFGGWGELAEFIGKHPEVVRWFEP